MSYGGSNDDVIDDVTWPWEVKVVIPISVMHARYFYISKTAWHRDSVLTGNHLPPKPYIKAVKNSLGGYMHSLSAFYSSTFFARVNSAQGEGASMISDRTHPPLVPSWLRACRRFDWRRRSSEDAPLSRRGMWCVGSAASARVTAGCQLALLTVDGRGFTTVIVKRGRS